MSSKIVPLGIELIRYGDPESVEETEEERERPNERRDKCSDGVVPEKSLENATERDELLLLDCIFPPREWEDEGTRWRQKVSHRPSTRADVAELIDTLDASLVHFQARNMDVCAIRSTVYSQCFDEMIRQVTLEDVERGLLLIKVRDELHMTTDAYRSLYESGTSFNAKVSAGLVTHRNEMDDLQKRIAELEAENQKVTDDLATAIVMYDKVQRLETERQLHDDDDDEEMAHLDKANQQIKKLCGELK